jgi:hypothetical protein
MYDVKNPPPVGDRDDRTKPASRSVTPERCTFNKYLADLQTRGLASLGDRCAARLVGGDEGEVH